MRDIETSVRGHYGGEGLLERILEGLRAAGKDPDALTHEDLAPADEFHSRGRAATRDLAEYGQVPRGTRVLDVGSGLGGAARYLAAELDCDVTGIDLVPDFCDVATELSRRVGLDGRTRFQAGSALEMPFADATFDVVWTIQMQMNIADKQGLYAEIARVLRPGGRFVFQDIFAGNGDPLHYPVPWASHAEQSFLIAPEGVRAMIAGLGLREKAWRDITAESVAWRKAQQAKAAQSGTAQDGPPPLSIHLVMGAHASTKLAISARVAEEGRVCSVQGVFEKPA